MDIKLFGKHLALAAASLMMILGCGGSGGDGTGAGFAVVTTAPVNGALLVPTSTQIVATFDQEIDSSNFSAANFTVASGSTQLPGTVSVVGNLATFQPTSPLPANTLITATIAKGTLAVVGRRLAKAYVWSFTTGVGGDTTAPTVLSTDPEDEETGVPVAKVITATFSETMSASTLNTTTFTVADDKGNIAGTVTLLNAVATFQPSANLDPTQTYTATITTGATDLSNNHLAVNKVWTFTTGGPIDSTPPTVTATDPVDGRTNAFLNNNITATFSEPMNASTINTTTFTIDGVVGVVTYEGKGMIATFDPAVDLDANTTYTARIKVGAQDLAGNGLVIERVWTFTTGVQRSQLVVDLGTASTYAVLAGSTVTNTGPTVVSGNLGVSPGTAVTGFPPGVVINGSIHAGDSSAAQAKADLLNGYNDAAGRLNAVLIGSDLTGVTLTPGLWRTNTSATIGKGALTLDAEGDSSAIFIIQIGSTLTTLSGSQVNLTGGAQASNVYWSVGSSATLGTNSIFKGNLLALISVTTQTGCAHTGALLSNFGAVTLDTNSVTNGG